MARKETALSEYNRKRNFKKTAEPEGKVEKGDGPVRRFVIQKHDASRLHYDLRLEVEGVYKSWAVPKGPSLDPKNKRLAVEVEDHPLDYGTFEGTIPEGEYGGGTVMLWDRGTYECDGDPANEHADGSMKLTFSGERMRGKWALVRMQTKGEEEANNWLFIKEKDEFVSTGGPDLPEQFPESVATGRTLDEITENQDSKNKEFTGPESGGIDPSHLKNATRRVQPETLKPQLAQLAAHVPSGPDWIHEVKFDGYRMLAFLEDGRVRIISRNNQDWTDRFREIADQVAGLPIRNGILDGEVVILNKDGVSDFGALQNFAQTGKGRLVYFAFDLPFCEGYDLRDCPLSERKELLAEILAMQSEVRYSDHIAGSGEKVFGSACDNRLEGIICKKATSRYTETRSSSWLKVKCIERQEFVVGGFTNPEGERVGFGALVLGVHDDVGRLVYCGRVGTGFNDQALKAIALKLKNLETKTSAFDQGPTGQEAKGVRYVEPKLVAEVEFSSWTGDGRLRHPSFRGLREDKKPEEIEREKAVEPDKSLSQEQGDYTLEGIQISHPERVIYPDPGISKWELAEYFDQIADWLLPHAANRPLALVRCPQGQEKECFFQKNYSDALPKAIHPVDIGDGEGIGIRDAAGLVSLAQYGVIEIHPWGSREGDIEHPDRITFDLDPSEELGWNEVVEAAIETRDILDQLGLESWVKTSGGKGLHVCVPLEPNLGWDEVKEFCHGVAIMMENKHPDRYISNMSKSKRKGKIFVDYLRNGRGATSVSAYSPRARKGAPVSVPITWRELPKIEAANQFDLSATLSRVKKQKQDSWADFFDRPQDLKAVLRRSQKGG